VGKANGSRECAPDGVPTMGIPWWARREERAFAHPTIARSVIASEAKQSSGAKNWIASSQELLAMTTNLTPARRRWP
jgi:hypothetical protein